MTKDARIDTTVVPSFACPVCAVRCDAVTGAAVNGDLTMPVRPQPGDAVICAYCTAVLMWTEVGIRVATQAECQDLSPLTLALLADKTAKKARR